MPITCGFGTGFIAFTTLSLLNLPTFLVYGLVRGFGQATPGNVIPEMIGALIGRFFLEKRYGNKNYKRYMMVLYAGFGAGMGLVAMASPVIRNASESMVRAP